MSGFRYDAHQQYQLDAIAAVVDLFEGMPAAVEANRNAPASGELLQMEIGAIGNGLLLDDDQILLNLQAVQARNRLEIANSIADDGLHFDVEMETGTGKTYVYLRTVFELAKHFDFTKFVVLVPSVPVKEGVISTIAAMEEHLRNLYAVPFDAPVYSGKSPEVARSFATSTSIQILVMTIDALRGDKNTRIIHQHRDQLNGLRPIDFLAATRPVIIMDEPQNMESDLSKSVVSELNPLCTLRYSATHRNKRNAVYRLDPVDAHDLGLVKQIVVADVQQDGVDATPYVKLLAVSREPSFRAKLELSVRRQPGGSLERRAVWVPNLQDLAAVTNNAAYSDNWRLGTVTYAPASIELTNGVALNLGESVGGRNASINREMIRETLREHLRKEDQLRGTGIKVLSLFFVPTVASYLGTGTSNESANGEFVKWFDELYEEERDRNQRSRTLLADNPIDLRRAYFSALKKRGGGAEYVDTSGTSSKDEDAYDLIMKDKARLLDTNEPVRFIFSHSALREGWDNPNVFQICTLRDMKGSDERRQTIGRGLRLPVAQSGDGFERVSDRSIAQLTVISNESYRDFAKSLQADYVTAGVGVGVSDFIKAGRRDDSGQPDNVNLDNPEFERLREEISRRTTYRVGLQRDDLVEEGVRRIKAAPTIRPLQVQVRMAEVTIGLAGTRTEEMSQRSAGMVGSYDFPDILSELQAATALTRRTLIDILVTSGRLDEFIANPNDFVQLVKHTLLNVLAATVVEGVRLEKVAGDVYELSELGEGELEELKRRQASQLNGSKDLERWIRVPPKFTIATPVGECKPDWALETVEKGRERIYFIREV